MNNIPPSVAIIIPSLNQGAFLQESINSLLKQTGVQLKVGLLDGGSDDNTSEVIFRYKHIFDYFRSYHDKGQAAAINEGVSILQDTEYVGWLNADDILLPGGLFAMAYFLKNHIECVAVFGKAFIINSEGRIIGKYPTKLFNKKSFAIRCTICQPASLIRRSAWHQIGGLDETLQTSMDYDMWWRLSKIGKIGYLNQFVACARDHTKSKTRLLRKKVNEEVISILLRYRGMVPRNWCMANILEGLEGDPNLPYWKRWLKGIQRYIQINKWKAILPQNWLI